MLKGSRKWDELIGILAMQHEVLIMVLNVLDLSYNAGMLQIHQ